MVKNDFDIVDNMTKAAVKNEESTEETTGKLISPASEVKKVTFD